MLLLLSFACGDPASTPDAPDANPSAVACEGDDGPAATVTIAPYLQSVTPTDAWVLWETTDGIGSRADHGPTDALGQTSCGTLVPMFEGGDPAEDATQVHEVHLTDLEPATTVYYRVQTGSTVSDVHHFRTPPSPGEPASFRVVALGDSQRDDGDPDRYREVIEQGVIGHTHSELGPDLADELALVMFAGDMVDSGWIYTDWTDDFFASGAPLMAEVPFYPVPGNHEGNSPFYFRYFHLPDDGQDEHWYTTDYANLRVVGLDSNGPYDSDEQLAWLDEVLTRTCDDPVIDFVFAQLHHPHRSELWTPGESDWSSQVVAKLEAFSSDCGKPSIHFFGHTHGYSRGTSLEHQHLWVNVSSAGGALDRWGPGAQDYPSVAVSQDTYGFVLVDVEAGPSPSFRLQRISRGNPDAPADNAVSDALTIWRDNAPPDAPAPASSAPCDTPPVLRATPFSDPEGHAHQATWWQVSSDCSDFSAVVASRYRQHTNEFMGVDTQAGDDLTDEPFEELTAGSLCWRVRYRDEGMVWSDWSVPEPLDLDACP